jgi:hypothetical protein
VQRLKVLSQQVKTLGQDLSQDVRRCVCQVIVVPLADALGPTLSSQGLLDEVIELTQVSSTLMHF